MSAISEDEAIMLSIHLDIGDEPFTSVRRSPEMIQHRFLIGGIEVTIEHVMGLQWSLYKRKLLEKHTMPDSVRFKITPEGITFCKRNGID
jgi:hypothetical protein